MQPDDCGHSKDLTRGSALLAAFSFFSDRRGRSGCDAMVRPGKGSDYYNHICCS